MNHARLRHLESLRGDPLRSPPRLLGPIHTRNRRRGPLQTVVPRVWLGWRVRSVHERSIWWRMVSSPLYDDEILVFCTGACLGV